LKISDENDRLNSTISKKIQEIAEELQKDDYCCEKIRNDLLDMQKQLDDLKGKR
jgi:hypothetical protein